MSTKNKEAKNFCTEFNNHYEADMAMIRIQALE
jgi:hypothetical protein